MKCEFCKKSSDETPLYRGVGDEKIIFVCEQCAEMENIPILKKPSVQQLGEADKRDSVRERLEKISGYNRRPISREQMTAYRNLARLKMPVKKQIAEDLLENYDWEIKMGRRRKKMSILQLANATGISKDILEKLEMGILPQNYEEYAEKIENALNVPLLKSHSKKIDKKEAEKELLSSVREKIIHPETTGHYRKSEKIMQIEKGEFDFSAEQNLDNITLTDLVRRKKQKEEREKMQKKREEHDDIFGGDIELEEE